MTLAELWALSHELTVVRNTSTDGSGRRPIPLVAKGGKHMFRPLVIGLAATMLAASGLGLGSRTQAQATPSPRGSDSIIWHVSRSPKLRVSVAGGCPLTVTMQKDVVNTFAGPPLVPANPTAGLICRYHGLPHMGRFGRQTRLDATQAGLLANVVRKLSLKPPPPTAGCPMDNGSFAILGFSYRGRADVGLWYSTSGCQIVDNGVIGSAQVANPSFYVGFEGAINKLSAPLSS